MEANKLQDTILARLYDAKFARQGRFTDVEAVAAELGEDKEGGVRAGEELEARGLASQPFLGMPDFRITPRGILEAESRQLGNREIRLRQLDLRRRVVAAFVAARQEHGPNHIVGYPALVRDLNFGEDEFLNNVDVLVDQGLLTPKSDHAMFYVASNHAVKTDGK